MRQADLGAAPFSLPYQLDLRDPTVTKKVIGDVVELVELHLLVIL